MRQDREPKGNNNLVEVASSGTADSRSAGRTGLVGRGRHGWRVRESGRVGCRLSAEIGTMNDGREIPGLGWWTLGQGPADERPVGTVGRSSVGIQGTRCRLPTPFSAGEADAWG